MMKPRLAISAGVAVGLLLSSQANARRTVIDAGEFLPQGTLVAGCTIGASCTATDLPFFFDFGNGSTNQAYIYDSGIISFGAPIPDGAVTTGPFTSFGVPVIAPLYEPLPNGTAGPYQVSTSTIGPADFDEILPNFPGTDLFLINFLDPDSVDEENNLSGLIQVIIDPSPTELRIEFIHGMSGQTANGIVVVLPDTAGTQMGYFVNGQQFFEGPPVTPDIVRNNAWSIFATAGVPEPGTWLTMLLGFGLMGLAFRRERRMRPQPA